MAVVDAAMGAVRVVTVGAASMRDLALIAFGGAGPLRVRSGRARHASGDHSARGVLSAVGLVCSPRQRELVRSWPDPLEHAGLEARSTASPTKSRSSVGTTSRWSGWWIAATGTEPRAHRRQPGRLPAEHERRNGFARPGAPVEVVALRVRARRSAPLSPADLPPVERPKVPAPKSWPSPTARCGCPTGGRPSPAPSALGCWRDDGARSRVAAGADLAVTGIAEEMSGAAPRRLQPEHQGAADCSAALFTAGGELLVQAEHIPVHLGSMPASVRAAVGRWVTASSRATRWC